MNIITGGGMKDDMKLRTRQISVSDLIWDRVKKHAREIDQPVKAVVRKAIILYLKGKNDEQKNRI
jgi:hypothetical protein